MAFEYACFISYRHCEGEIGKRFVEDLRTGIFGELELLGRKVFFDSGRLSGGSLYNEALASELCRSTCMLMVFAPNYFDRLNRYCSREFQAMEAMEKERLQRLPANKRSNGLIIPIVVRGAKFVPERIRGIRLFEDFSSFTLADPVLSKHPILSGRMTQIAHYIEERCRDFDEVQDDLCASCGDFRLPSEADVEALLSETTRRAEFPLRGPTP